MNVVSWRGANGNWTKWHIERGEYPYSLYCRATVAERTATIRKKLDPHLGDDICKECRQNLYLEMIRAEHHRTD